MRTINATAGAASVATPASTPQTQSPVAKGSASHKRPPTLKSQGTDLLPDGFNSLTLTSADSMLDQTRYPTPSETLELLAYPRSRPHVSLKRQRERDDDECMEDIEMTGSDPKRPRLTREVSPSEPIFDYHDDINCNETLDDVLAPPNTLRHSTVAAFSAYTPRGQSEPLYPNFQTPDSSRQSHKAFDLTQISFKCEERTSPCPSSPLGKVLTVDYFSNCPTRSMSWLSKLEYVSPRAEERYRLGSYLPNTESASDQFAVYMLKWDTMFEIESRCRPSCEYLNKHHLITEQMRMILCQWLSEVASDSHNKSTRQTYHRSVAYLDFIMSYDSNIGSDEFQYVGAAALYFAAKLEELSYEGHVANLITFEMEFLDDQISEEERLKTHVEAVERMRKYESKLLKIPHFDHMEIPTAYDWLLLYLQNFELIRLSKQSTKTMQLSRGSTPIVELSRSSTPLSEASNLLVVEEPEFSLLECRLNQKLFKGAVELLDHLILDYTSLKFQNSLLAAGVFQMQALVEDDEMLATTGFSVGQLSEVLHFIENFDVYWMCQNDVTIQSDKFYLQTPTNLSAEKMFDKWNQEYDVPDSSFPNSG